MGFVSNFNAGSFCFIFSLQSGVVMCVLVFGVLMLVSFWNLIYFLIGTSSFGYHTVPFLITFAFMVLLCVGLIICFIAAYHENSKMMVTGAVITFIALIVFIIVAILSFLPGCFTIVCFSCRCPDHLWLQQSYWRTVEWYRKTDTSPIHLSISNVPEQFEKIEDQEIKHFEEFVSLEKTRTTILDDSWAVYDAPNSHYTYPPYPYPLHNDLGAEKGPALQSNLGAQTGPALQSDLGAKMGSGLESDFGTPMRAGLESNLGPGMRSGLDSDLGARLGSPLQSNSGAKGSGERKDKDKDKDKDKTCEPPSGYTRKHVLKGSYGFSLFVTVFNLILFICFLAYAIYGFLCFANELRREIYAYY